MRRVLVLYSFQDFLPPPPPPPPFSKSYIHPCLGLEIKLVKCNLYCLISETRDLFHIVPLCDHTELSVEKIHLDNGSVYVCLIYYLDDSKVTSTYRCDEALYANMRNTLFWNVYYI